ncbi:MAG TPA: condensation domain-containing protein, partial [Thermoanaerobaculia bacterium]|nr:condensation domain-containing protein [Thermoanaerobaculia bacterium]
MGDSAGAKGKASPGGFGAVLDRLREKKRQVLSGTYDPIMPARPDPAGAPLSFAQQRLWFLAQLRPDDPSYNVAAAVDVRGRLAVPALAEAFRRVAERHETLRTTFEVAAGQPTQVVQAHGPEPPLPAIDLEALAQGAEAEGERLARAAAARPFDLERGPLLRTFLVRLDPDRHLLVLTLHHLVGDAWSIGVLIREISALYRAALGQPASVPPLPVQYADFAVWQREKLQGDAPLAWWMERLKGAPPELELPADRPRPPVSSGRGARHRLALPTDTVTGLQAVARSEETTLFVVLLAGFQALLRRWTGQEDVVVGTPFANRRRLEIQGLIGFFVNTLPIRTDLTGRSSFRELLRQVREHVLSAHAHQDLPFERIVEELRPERAAGRNPFFQVVFAFQNVPLPALELPGLELTARHIDSATAMFDLTLDLAEQADGIQGWLEYATDLFAPTTAARFAAQWRNLLAAASEAPDSPFLDLPLLAPAEHHQLVTEWNDRAAAVPAVSIQRLFEEQADLWPEAVAVEDGRRSLTYAELDARANRLARHLRRRGVAPEVPVAFCLERSIEAVETILAILKAGGAYVPLSPSYPAERLSWLMADSGVRVLVTAPGTPAPLVPREIATVDLARDAKAIARRSAGRLLDETDPGALAYVLYTSGSTGHPKGVAVTHRNVVRLVRGTDFAAFGPEEVWLLLAPLSFDASTLELWGPLLNGGRLSIFPSRVPSLEDLARLLETRGVTALWLTAGLFHQMVDLRPEALRSLRRLLAGGDVLSPSHVRRALQAGIALVNGYGPTEGTTFTCCHAMLAPEEAGDGARVSIGRPIANARVYVAGPGVEPAPIGVAGELLAGGEGLARGYLGRPDL